MQALYKNKLTNSRVYDKKIHANCFTSIKKKFTDGSWINEVHHDNSYNKYGATYQVRVKSISRLFGE